MRLYPNISLIFIVWFLSLVLIGFTAFNLLPNSGQFQDNFFQSFANWDGGHYLGIAESGYKEKFQYAFFPLYPVLIKGLNLILQNYLLSGILISILSSFFALQLLYQLISEDFDKKVAEKVILSLLFFPTSFYFLTAYSEGLFIFLVITTFYFLKRNNLLYATIFASLASVCKLSGLAVVFALLIHTQITGGLSKKNWFVLLSPFGFVIYCWFLLQQTGDPFYFLTAENHWQRYITIPGVSFWETIRSIASGSLSLDRFSILLDLLFAVFGIGFALRSLRLLPPAYSFYTLFSIGFPLLTSTLTSIPRFLVVIFPIFILVALIKNKYLTLVYQIISLMLLSLFIALFVNGYWVS